MNVEEPAQKTEVTRKKFSSLFYLFLFLSVLVYYLDGYLAESSMSSSTKLSEALQRSNIIKYVQILETITYFLLDICIFFLYIFSRDVISSFSIITLYSFSVFACLLLQLLYSEGRPIFYNILLAENIGYCSYGKPMIRLFCQIVAFMWMDANLEKLWFFSQFPRLASRICMFVISATVIFCALFLGVNAYHQVVLTIVYAVFYYTIHAKLENFILHYVLLPILEKDKLMEKKSIIFILSMIVAMNYIVITAWSWKFTRFENLENGKFKFRACVECLAELDRHFSTSMVTTGLIFNLLFGMYLGIYTLPQKVFEFDRFVTDYRPRMIVYRLIFSVLFVLPLLLLYAPDFRNPYASILKSIFSSMFVGFLITNALLRIMKQISEARVEFSDQKMQFFMGNLAEESIIAISVNPDDMRDMYV
jgi:hypothetical protein